MNQLTYQLAVSHNQELLRQAEQYRLARQIAATTEAAPGAAAHNTRRRPRWMGLGLLTTRGGARAHTAARVE